MQLKNMRRGEDTEQIKVILWAAGAEHEYPELKWLYHIPNGGTCKKDEAGRLKQMGVKRGVSDLHLPYPHGGYHGLYIEMKYEKNTTTKEQTQFLCDMCDARHCVAVCYDMHSAVELIKRYIDLPENGLIDPDKLEGINFRFDNKGIIHIKSGQPFA